MVNSYNNLPASTKLLLQSLVAVLGSVLVGVLTAAYQNYTQAGHLDTQALINVSLVTFALLFGKAMHDWVPAHAQALLKAAQDEKAAMYEALQRSQNVTSAVIATQGKQVQSNPVAPSHVVVPVPTSLKSEDVSAIAAQLAVNLINIAADRASQATASTTPAPTTPVVPVAPPEPAEPPYIDPLRNSAVLPAYKPPVAIPDQATQVVPQVPFTV